MAGHREFLRRLATALSMALSTACGETRASMPTGDTPDATPPGLCGETVASCPSDVCNGSRCALVVLADLRNVRRPSVVGADGVYVYLASDSGLYRVRRCGGPIETLALSTVPFEFVEIAGDSVLFHLPQPTQSIFQMPRAGGTSQELNANADVTSASLVALKAVGGDVYAVVGSTLSVMPQTGGTLAPLLDGSGFGSLAGDEEYVYFHRISGLDEGLFRMKRGQLSPDLLLATTDGSSFPVSTPAVDTDFAYIADGPPDGTHLHRVAKNTLMSTTIATLDDVPQQMASDGHCVYFSFDEMNSANGSRTLHRMPAAGGASELLAASALGFALDDTAYYFSTGEYLFRSPK